MGKALRSVGRFLKKLLSPLAPFGGLLKDAFMGMLTHNASRMAGAIAFFGAFSLAPILVIAVSLASIFFGRSASEGLIVDKLTGIFGKDVASFIQDMLAAIYASGGLTVATVLAILLVVWGSTRIIGSLRGALNDIWGVPGHGGTGFLGFVFGKLIDVGMVIGIGFMFVATMLANTAVSAVTGYFSDRLPMPGWLLELIGIAFSLAVITMFLAIIFRALPNIKIRFVYILMGAWVTAILFTIGNYVIGRYLGRTSPGSAFSVAGSLAVLMIWMYYSSYIILFGAEVTRAYAQRGRLRRAKAAPAEDADITAETFEIPGETAALPGKTCEPETTAPSQASPPEP